MVSSRTITEEITQKNIVKIWKKFNAKESSKGGREERNRHETEKKMADINLSITTLNEIVLNNHMTGRGCQTGEKNKIQQYAIYKTCFRFKDTDWKKEDGKRYSKQITP